MKIISHLHEQPPASATRSMIKFQDGHLLINDEPQPIISTDDRDQMVMAFDQLATECQGASHLATFALGGLLPMLDLQSSGKIAGDVECHIFNGLSWRGPGCGKLAFLAWLKSLNPADTVVIFDTGCVGNAIGTVSVH